MLFQKLSTTLLYIQTTPSSHPVWTQLRPILIVPTFSCSTIPKKKWTASWSSSLARSGPWTLFAKKIILYLHFFSDVHHTHTHTHTHTQVDSYTRPLVKLVEEVVQKYNGAKGSVINFNCGPGLISFLLTKTFQQVRINSR